MTTNVNNDKLPQKEFAKVDYSQKVLEVKNLKKHFTIGSGPDKVVVPAVDGVTFDVYKQEVFGLVGESGCGKTTTGRTIIKLYDATEGSVDLNGVRISAGYHNYVAEIKETKKKIKEDIISLDKSKSEIIKIKEEAATQIGFIEEDKAKRKAAYKVELEHAKSDIARYKAEKYNLKNDYKLAVSDIKYQFSLEKAEIENSMTNQVETTYQNELAIALKTFENKESGLKDSAALTQEVIKERIDEIKVEYDQQVQELEEKYLPLIEAEVDNLVDKETGKEQIAVLKKKTDEALALRKEKYKEDLANIKKPNMESVRQQTNEVKAAYKQDIEALNEKINQIKDERNASIAGVSKSSGLTEEDKLKAKEIKAEGKAKIAELKAKIRDAKAVNKSKDALKHSQKMQMIFQDPISSLNPRMTVKEIIGEGLKIQNRYDEETIDALVKDALQIVGLSPEYATRYPHEFSGGQRQRIGIARALVMNPDFVIADEPISSLDVSIRAQVINLLTELKEELGLTILFIAHDLSVVRFFCDRIAVMYYGQIVELAPAEELFQNPLHPYTISLLSAIPQPDPDYEKGRKRITYDASMHDYRIDKPELKEFSEGHFVYANEAEFNKLKENNGLKLDELDTNNQ